MTKEQYLESLRGQPYSVIVANQPMINIVGSIRGDNLRNVVDILAKGLQDRIDFAPHSSTRTALIVVFKYLGLENYQINLSIPENIGLLQLAVNENLVTPTEYAQFLALATYQKPEFDITVADCVEYFGGVGDWMIITQLPTSRLQLKLDSDMPEETLVRIEMRESHNGTDWTKWNRVSHFYNVHKAGYYYRDVPWNGLQREVRVRGEVYRIDGTVAVV